jgi:signal transduction histidine kinase
MSEMSSAVEPDVRPVLVPWLVAGTTTGLGVATLVLAVGLGASLHDFLAGNEASQWLSGLATGLLGGLILRTGRNRLGPILSISGILGSAAGFCQAYAAPAHAHGWSLAPEAAWVASYGWLGPLLATLMALPLLYPDGRLRGARWRWPARLSLTVGVVGYLLVLTTGSPLSVSVYRWARIALVLAPADGFQLGVALLLLLVVVLTSLVAATDILVGMRRRTGSERARSAWFASAVLLGIAAIALPLPLELSFAVNLLSFAALGAGIARHRLFDIEAYLPRALASTAIAAAGLVVYLVVAAQAGARISHDTRSGILAALATAATTLVLARGLDRLQELASRLLFGDRRDPQRSLLALGERLAGTVDSDQVLPATVESVCSSLRLPYAAVVLTGEDTPAASSGTPSKPVATFRLRHAGQDVGRLEVGLRAGERTLDDQDDAVLTAFAQQVAVAAHGVRATRELRRSREQVVLTREEERRRIHRDLHDGLGPALAGISLGLETARRGVARDPGATEQLLEGLREDASDCVAEVRRIVTGLRPPVLDQSGLLGALHHHAETVSAQSGGQLAVSVAGATGPLPPAVEMAAYRIVTEALSNAVRHAAATRCGIRVCEQAAMLHLVVEDDGSGEPPARSGHGLATMRQRAEELGGSCEVRFRPGSGTTVTAEFPLHVGSTP